MNDYTEVQRDEFLTYLDTTPTSTATYKLLGPGVTEYAIEYNPQIDKAKWINEKNSRNNHSSNQKQGSISQTIEKGDDLFDFVYAGRDKLNYKTHILDIDVYKGINGVYPAKLNDGMIAITKYMGDTAKIEYDLYYEGDTIDGTVVITNGVPVFTSGASL